MLISTAFFPITVPGTNFLAMSIIGLHAFEPNVVSILFILISKKVFDSVPVNRLLLKLKRYGISGKIMRWIFNFLDGRFFQN